MLRGGCDVVDRLLFVVIAGRFDELSAQVLQSAYDGRRHLHAAPACRRAIEHGPHKRQAALLSGQPADHLHPPAGLAEGALD